MLPASNGPRASDRPHPVRVALYPLLIVASACSASPGAAARFMYVVGCEATVEKLDTYTDREVQNVALATRTGKERIIPEPAGTQQYCLSEGALYVRSRQRFYTVVALESEVGPNDNVDYDLLGFSVPELRLVDHRTAARKADHAPSMVAESAGEVSLHVDAEPALATAVNLGIEPRTGLPIRAQIIETADAVELVQIFSKDPAELILGVARQADHSHVRLRGLPETTPEYAHLTPGGQAVLVEETKIDHGTVTKTSRLVLFDSGSGERIAEFTDPAVAQGSLMAIAPVGKAVYYDGDRYRFVNLGRSFEGSPAVRPGQLQNGRVFFADR